MRLLIPVGVFVLGPPLFSWIAHPSGGFTFNIWASGVLVVSFACLLAIFLAPAIAAYVRPRRQRERYLNHAVTPSQIVQSIYLTPNLFRFIEEHSKTRLSPFEESVSLVSTPSSIEFWSGGPHPIRCEIVEFTVIESVQLVEDDKKFPRPEIRLKMQTIPLYPTAGWLRISRASSRSLYDRLFAAFEEAKNSSTSVN